MPATDPTSDEAHPAQDGGGGERDERRPIERLGLIDLMSPDRLAAIYASGRDYYWSDEWTPEFFVAQARAAFISIAVETETALGQVLLPQIHLANAVLDWKDLYLSRSTRRWMRSAACVGGGYELEVGGELDEVIAGIARCHGEDNWLAGRYPALLREVDARSWNGVRLLPVALLDRGGQVVAGELGVVTGRVYTSMTGFLDRGYPRFNHLGKLQMFMLAEHLRDRGFAFWNLGQPWMQYKFDLGAKAVGRLEFLQRWFEATG